MGVKDKVSTYFKNLGSKRNESSDIKDLEKKIEEQIDIINKLCSDIGEYYWNQYSKNALIPDNESRPLFEKIRDANREIDNLKAEIEEVKKNRDEERKNNRVALENKEKRDAEAAKERKRQKELQAREKEKEKELEKAKAAEKPEDEAKN